MSAFICGRCGHSADEHGRRGYGACRHGMVRGSLMAVLLGEGGGSIGRPACACKRYRVTPVPEPMGTPGETRGKEGT
jgi:hypothetical protein